VNGNTLGYNVLGSYIVQGYTESRYDYGKKVFEPEFLSVTGKIINSGSLLLKRFDNNFGAFAVPSFPKDFTDNFTYHLNEIEFDSVSASFPYCHAVGKIAARQQLLNSPIDGIDNIADEGGQITTGRYFEYSITDGLVKKGIVDVSGNLVTMPEYDSIVAIGIKRGSLFFKVYNNGHVGIVGQDGAHIFEPTFDRIETDPLIFQRHGLGVVEYQGKYGLISSNLDIVVDPEFYNLYVLNKKYALISDGRVWDFYDLETKKRGGLNIDNVRTEDLGNSRIPIQIRANWGYCNAFGKVVIPPQYAYVTSFAEGIALVVKEIGSSTSVYPKKYCFIINSNGQTTATVNSQLSQEISQVDQFSEGLLLFKSNVTGKFGFINQRGSVAINPIFEAATRFANGRSFVQKFGANYYIDKVGNRINDQALHSSEFKGHYKYRTNFCGICTLSIDVNDAALVFNNAASIDFNCEIHNDTLLLKYEGTDGIGFAAFNGENPEPNTPFAKVFFIKKDLIGIKYLDEPYKKNLIKSLFRGEAGNLPDKIEAARTDF